MTNVVWFSENPESIARGFWDQGWLEELFAGRLWKPTGPTMFTHHSTVDTVLEDGAVLIVPARWHADRVPEVQAALDKLNWCLLVLTGDEENVFPRDQLHHERLRVWVQTPKVGTERDEERYVGDFWPPLAPSLLRELGWEKSQDWFFAGQVNTEQRKALVKKLTRNTDGTLLATHLFGSGLEYGEYLRELARARVAPCPDGPFTPDTFRVFEALEAGVQPVVAESPYWQLLFGEEPPFSRALRVALEKWPDNATISSCWFQQHKRELARRFFADLQDLSGQRLEPVTAGDRITVLIPTSSAPGDPDTAMIEETVASVHERLPDCETIVMLDGLHPQHEHRRGEYAEYRRRVAWLAEHRWPNTLPLFFSEHRHQAAMTRYALDQVHTPHVLFVEHDAPLVGEVSFDDLCAVLEADTADLIRLHHEAAVHPAHAHMMLDQTPRVEQRVPLLRTVQWSQRPHLATAAFYRRILREHFAEGARTMIEDVMHGAVYNAWRDFGPAGWDRYRLWMYAPEGDLKRSTHLDARAGEEKVPMMNE